MFCFTFSLCTVLANPKTCDPNTLSKSASDQIAKISIGSCVFVFDLPHADNVAAAAARKTVVVWRGEKYLNIMVRKQDAESLLFVVRRLLGISSRPRQAFRDAQDKLKAESAAAAAEAAPQAPAAGGTSACAPAPSSTNPSK